MGRFGSPSSLESSCNFSQTRDNNTDLRLGLSISISDSSMPCLGSTKTPKHCRFCVLCGVGNRHFIGFSLVSDESMMRKGGVAEENECNSATFFVKVYMEGIPIGRKLDLLAHHGYHDLITTLDQMFCTNIIWAEMDGEQSEQCHVLTYEDKEGDWLMVGDVPWEMFLCSVKRLKITRVEI